MLPVLFAVSLAIGAWARWLVGSRRAPRWVRWTAPLVGLTTIGTGVYVLWRLHQAFASTRNASPADRQHQLASGISHAYTVLAIGWGIAVVATAVLTAVTLRRSRATLPP